MKLKLKLTQITLAIASLLVIVTPVLIACGTDQSQVMLEDTVWVLKSYGETGNLKAVFTDTEITIEFKSEEGQFAGSGGCNNNFGGYEINKNKIVINFPIGSTAMSCGEKTDAQEREYLRLLETTNTFQIQNGKLTISCSDNNDLLFVEK